MTPPRRRPPFGAIAWLFAVVVGGGMGLPGPADAQGKIEQFSRVIRPDGAGPFPAVILVSGCGGLAPDRIRAGERLKSQGYVVLFLDYLGARGLKSACRGELRPADIGRDIIAAATWLKGQPGVDPARIAMLGWSLGGGSVLAALGQLSGDSPPIRSAVAFYPACREVEPWTAKVPVLILLGGRDDVTPARPCQEVAAKVASAGPRVEVRLYPEARHSFDMESLPAVAPFPGRSDRTVGHHAPSSTEAWSEVQKFLESTLRPT